MKISYKAIVFYKISFMFLCIRFKATCINAKSYLGDLEIEVFHYCKVKTNTVELLFNVEHQYS